MSVRNSVTLIGRLTRDPEVRVTPNTGTTVANFSVAVDRSYKDANGERGTDYFDCIAWRKLGEHIGNYLSKGRLVAVEGELQNRSYETQDGQKRRVTEVICRDVQFLDSKKNGEAPAPEEAPVPDEVPF